MVKAVLAVLAAMVLMVGAAAQAAETGHGGHGHGGHGHGGHGHGHHGGHHGGHNGHSAPSAPSVSAPSVDTSAPSIGGTWAPYDAKRADGAPRERTLTDLAVCTSPPTPSYGLVSYDTRADGSFSYWGYEFAEPDFVQCMKDKGYKMPTAGRSELTNFGQR